MSMMLHGIQSYDIKLGNNVIERITHLHHDVTNKFLYFISGIFFYVTFIPN